MTDFLDVVVSGAITASQEWPWREIEAWTSAIGQEHDALAGRPITRLLEALAPTATQAIVESTFRWPSTGAVWIGGQRATYASKTDGTLDGLVYPWPRDPRATIAAWTPIVLDPQSIPADELPEVAISHLDAACRNTSPATAVSPYLSTVSNVVGLPLIAGWDANDWRAALSWAANIARDRRPVIDGFLRRLFASQEIAVAVTLSTSDPTRITAAAAFVTEDDIGRWLTLDGHDGTFVIDTVADSGLYCTLSRIGGGPYGLAPAWWSQSETTTARLLAYAIVEDPRRAPSLDVQLWVLTSQVPPSYLQPPAAWLLYRTETAAFAVGDRLVGQTSQASALIAALDDNGTTGALELQDYDDSTPFISGEIIVSTRPDGTTGGSATANGSPGDQLLAYDTEGTGFVVGDTVIGETSNCIADVVGVQDDGTTGLLALRFIEAPPRWIDGEDLEVDGAVISTADGGSIARHVPYSRWLIYNGSTQDPVVGELLTGTFSAATGIAAEVVLGTGFGAVRMTDITGVWSADDSISGSLGANGDANGATGDHLLLYPGGGTFAVFDEVTGATSGAVGILAGLQTIGALALQWTGVGGVATAYYLDGEDLLVDGAVAAVANGDSITRERPTGEPNGGHLMADVSVDGTGKYPIYLRGQDANPELESLLDRMVAGGVRVRCVYGPAA